VVCFQSNYYLRWAQWGIRGCFSLVCDRLEIREFRHANFEKALVTMWGLITCAGADRNGSKKIGWFGFRIRTMRIVS
jgi:hypothetical protein